ncbi:hypothetical protein HZA97_05935 [Candidatus Woesearchaeota archaeon]|nr:hypothetical protein [Candidatus Woesearchaeota archaeon]
MQNYGLNGNNFFDTWDYSANSQEAKEMNELLDDEGLESICSTCDVWGY